MVGDCTGWVHCPMWNRCFYHYSTLATRGQPISPSVHQSISPSAPHHHHTMSIVAPSSALPSNSIVEKSMFASAKIQLFLYAISSDAPRPPGPASQGAPFVKLSFRQNRNAAEVKTFWATLETQLRDKTWMKAPPLPPKPDSNRGYQPSTSGRSSFAIWAIKVKILVWFLLVFLRSQGRGILGMQQKQEKELAAAQQQLVDAFSGDLMCKRHPGWDRSKLTAALGSSALQSKAKALMDLADKYKAKLASGAGVTKEEKDGFEVGVWQ